MDKLLFTCLKNINENKTAKPIDNYLDLFIKTSLNQMFIRSRLVNQPKNELILPPNPRGKNSTNTQIHPWTLAANKISKVRTIKILLNSGASKEFLKMKRINGQLWQGPLILIS